MVKLYGVTRVFEFPCICYGLSCFFFKIAWSKKKRRFVMYKGFVSSEEIIYQAINNTGKFKFVGCIISCKNMN